MTSTKSPTFFKGFATGPRRFEDLKSELSTCTLMTETQIAHPDKHKPFNTCTLLTPADALLTTEKVIRPLGFHLSTPQIEYKFPDSSYGASISDRPCDVVGDIYQYVVIKPNWSE